MAVISKIRQKSILLLIVLGVALLGFILGSDFISGRGNNGQPEQFIAEVDGKDIHGRSFSNLVEEQIEMYKENAQVSTVPDQVRDQIRDQVWNDMIQEQVLIAKAKEAGVDVTGEEFVEGMIKGANPHPSIRQNFTNPQTGEYNAANVLNMINNLENDETGEDIRRWEIFEDGVRKDQIKTKYFNLLKKGMYVTTLQANHDATSKNQKASISYVGKRYTTIKDDEVEIAEADIQKYYNEHKSDARFQQKEATRSIDYVVFDVIPTSSDTELIVNTLKSLKKQFKDTKDDTLFVSSYGSTGGGNIRYYTKHTVPANLDTVIFQASVGEVLGPIMDEADGKLKLIKVIETKEAPDSVKASHILIRINNGDTTMAQAKADSLQNLLKQGADFTQLALQNSEDQGSAANGGDLGWFQEGQMIKPFNDASFNGKTGDIVQVMSNYGIHIINITDQTESVEKRLVANIDKQIIPTRSTTETAYNQANAFSLNNAGETFVEKGNEMGLRIADGIKETDKTVRGLGESRDLVRWIYEAERGNVSEPIELEDKFVVARLSNIKPKGTLTLEQVKEEIEAEVLKEKKAEKIMAMLSGGNDLQAASSAWGSPVETAQNVSFSAYSVPGLGAEKKVIGATFALSEGSVSKPIKGEFGVYLVKVDGLTKTETQDVSFNKKSLARAYASRVDYQAFNVLKEKANIKDNRSKFF